MPKPIRDEFEKDGRNMAGRHEFIYMEACGRNTLAGYAGVRESDRGTVLCLRSE